MSSGPNPRPSSLARTIRLGTRGSVLALAQANWVADRLRAHHPHCQVELVIIKTTGDKIHHIPLAEVGGKGLFIKEIEEALLAGEVDLAVHSLKDMPAEIPPGLILDATPPREDCRDVLISPQYQSLMDIPAGGRIGTGSLRRRAQVLHLRPDLEVVGIRGNVDTRLRKMAELGLDGLILAAAGLNRLGLPQVPRWPLPEAQMLPAVGQGALGLEVREDDDDMRQAIAGLDDAPTRIAVTAERGFLARLEGGCKVPLAALGRLQDGGLTLEALISDPEGKRLLREKLTGPPQEAEDLGHGLAERLLAQGGAQILAELYGRPV